MSGCMWHVCAYIGMRVFMSECIWHVCACIDICDVCAHVWVHVACVCMHRYACMWWPEANLECHPQKCHLSPSRQDLSWHWCPPITLDSSDQPSPGILPSPSFLTWNHKRVPPPSPHSHGFQRLDTGPPAYRANTFWLFPRPQHLFHNIQFMIAMKIRHINKKISTNPKEILLKDRISGDIYPNSSF